MDSLTPDEIAVLKKMLLGYEFQNLLGGEMLGLTEEDEGRLWVIIVKIKKRGAQL